MIELSAKLRLVRRDRISISSTLQPIYDDNLLFLVMNIATGPTNVLGTVWEIQLGSK